MSFPTPDLTDEAARLISPLELAFVGDSVHTLLTRARLMGYRPRDMQRMAAGQVNARAQAEALERLMPYLSDAENDIVRRGRNAHARHPAPHSAGEGDYHASTALEALYGYLYLTGRFERLEEIDRLSRGKDDNA